MKFIHSAPTAIAIALGALCSFSVNAQSAAPAATDATAVPSRTLPSSAAPSDSAPLDSAPASSPTSAAIDDSKLEQFATAYVKIQTIQKESIETQKSATDPTAAQQQQAELQSKMAEAVQTSGLDVNEFNQIAQAMTTDANLRAKVIAKVQQRTQNSGG